MDASKLEKVLADHKKWLTDPTQGKQAHLASADLQGCNLRGADLRSANLHCAKLRYADLHSAKLRGADLSHADLLNANLCGAGLQRADLKSAYLGGTILREADLLYAALHCAGLDRACLSGADLSHADLSSASLRFATLDNVILGGAQLFNTDLSGAVGLLNPIKWLETHLERTARGYIAYKIFGNVYSPPKAWRIEPGAIIREVCNPNPTSDCGCGVNMATREWVGDFPTWRVLIRWEWLPGVVVPYNTTGKFRGSMCELLNTITCS